MFANIINTFLENFKSKLVDEFLRKCEQIMNNSWYKLVRGKHFMFIYLLFVWLGGGGGGGV